MTTKAQQAARLLGRKGGKARAASIDAETRREWSVKGGKAAAEKSTHEERSARAKAAAKARWGAKRKASVDS
jgi:general stress protein YciG